MTTFDMIYELIERKTMKEETARALIFDAYYKNRIDGQEYEELRELAKKYL